MLPEELAAEADGGIADGVLDGVVGYMENAKSWVEAGESECVVAILWQYGRGWVVRLNNNNSYHLLMINEIPIQQPS